MTNIVRGWADGTFSNFGFLIKLDNESGTYKGGVFDSKEYAEEYGYGGAILEITYAVPTIESCNQVGGQKDHFELEETAFVAGGGYSPSTTYNFYIVEDVQTWADGIAVPERVSGTLITVSSNNNGAIAPTAIWTGPQTVGKFDIVVDVNGNGQYDLGIDALDDSDIEVTAGFSVIPELSSSLILLLVVATLLIIAVPKGWSRKGNHRRQRPSQARTVNATNP